MSDAPLAHKTVDTAAAAGVWRERLAGAWHEIEGQLIKVSDWLNPILVKETRQALKSWQFALTFVLLLVACWIVTIGGIALIGPSVYYAAGGGDLLRAYYFVLALALFVVVPFAAFRSLASEREDNTYDLLTITALRPRQIIGGKIGSAIVQMAVYFSAITPCLAFTYLLRGVDVPTIALLLVYSFFASLALSMIGLLLATLTRQRYHQVILSVAFVAVLLFSFAISQEWAEAFIRNGYLVLDQREFWIVNLGLASFFATAFAMAFLAATAMISFTSENRSTPLRVSMLAQQAVFVGWMAYAWLDSDYDDEVVVVLAFVAFVFWWLMGAMLTGERGELSRRVQRHLPQSTLGRVFFAWFKPGPSSGYMFAVVGLLSIVAMAVVATMLSRRGTWVTAYDMYAVLIVGTGYVVAYLGLGCLAIAWLRRVSVVTMFAGVLIHLLLVLAGSGIPTSVQLMSLELRNEPYSYLQITNPVWTLYYLTDYSSSPESSVLLMVIPAAAVCVLLLNLPEIIREMRQVRAMLPARVAQDEAELHPAPGAGPQNPWEADTDER